MMRGLLLPVVAAALCATAAGCSKGVDPPFKATFAIVTGTASGGFEAGSFGARARAGLLTCAALSGASIALDTATPGNEDRELLKLATENPDEVVAVGGEFAEPLKFVAKNYEGTHFALIDGFVDRPNVSSVTFKMQEGTFLAGALAALVSRSKNVAFLAGGTSSELEGIQAGYVAGVREIDPKIHVKFANAGSFTDKTAAKKLAFDLFKSGVDVIFVAAGPGGLGAIDAVQMFRGAYVIGVDSDQDAAAKGKVLTSVLRRYDNAANLVCQELSGQKAASGVEAIGLADGGVSLTRFAYSKGVIGLANMARIDRLSAAIVAKKIVPPATMAEAAKFEAVPVP